MSTFKILQKFISHPKCLLTLYFLLLNLVEENFVWVTNFVKQKICSVLVIPNSSWNMKNPVFCFKTSWKLAYFFLLLFWHLVYVKVVHPKDILNCCSVQLQGIYWDVLHERQYKMYLIALGQKWKLSLSMKWTFRSITTEVNTAVGVLRKKKKSGFFK